MPKRKENSGKVKFEDVVWVIDNLDAKQLAAHDEKPFNSEEILDLVGKMIEQDFSITCRWDDYSDSFQATGKCVKLKAENAGLALSARSDDMTDCLSILLYKYFIIAEANLKPFAEKKPKGVRG